MIIKHRDGRSEDVRILKSLLEREDLSDELRKKIDWELTSLLSGIKGEREAAYEIDFHYGASRNWAIIHDLRLEHKGRVAQIDHVLINRALDLYVCESKRFSEGVEINERGEFCAVANGKAYGIPSPVEQNRRHILVLDSILDDGLVDVPTRLGFYLLPKLRSLVLVSRGARIQRPKVTVPGLESIVKVDQVRAHIDKIVDEETSLLDAARVVSTETLERLAKGIAALHQPMTFDWAARFGLRGHPSGDGEAGSASKLEAASPQRMALRADGTGAGLVCSSCGVRLTEKVARFCRVNRDRFGGNLYCIDCQRGRQAPS